MTARIRASPAGLALLLALASLAGAAFAQAPAARPMDVLHYQARLDPDLANKQLRGQVRIRLRIVSNDTRELLFDAGKLSIDSVRENGRALAFDKPQKQLRVQLPAPAAAGELHEIEVRYHGAPSFGLEFHPDRGELYTIFSTSQWLVCVDAPDERASLDLSIALPAGMQAAGNGRLLSKTVLEGQRELYRWSQDAPVPSYVYGFAAGPYRSVSTRAGGVMLNFLSSEQDADGLRHIFADTGDMLGFFSRRAGLPYRGSYSQVLVGETIGQELAGLSLLSEDYGRSVLATPTAESLIAHELAHQWWGNRITCVDWGHFWLNEGFATFMAAAYMQHRFGDAEYQKVVTAWQQRIEKLRADGKDHALVFSDWNKPSRDDRAVVYQKGAYVLHLLRAEVGERAFWRGIRDYTRAHDGQSVSTPDFQRAMERASRRQLSDFFSQWVYGPN